MLFRSLRRILCERIQDRCPDLLLQRVADLPLICELSNGRKPRCRTGISRQYDEFSVGSSIGGPFEIVWRFRRLAVLIRPNKRDIEVIPGISKVVEIPAEERRLLLGCENDAKI